MIKADDHQPPYFDANAQPYLVLRLALEVAYQQASLEEVKPDSSQLMFEISTLLNLLCFATAHPTQTDYTGDFGEYTANILEKFAARCRPQTQTTDPDTNSN